MQTRDIRFESLSDDQMYDAMLRADGSYDGVFYTGVLTTGIYCLPSCTGRKPLRKNVRFFPSREAAQEAGLRACKRCCPDLEGGRDGYEASLVEQAKLKIEASLEEVSASYLAVELGLSTHHLMRLFRKVTGRSLAAYIRERRMSQAVRMLEAGEVSILEVAAASGFRSTSSLYTAFAEAVNMPPGKYRQSLIAGS